MEFDGKDELMGRIAASASLRERLEELTTYKALALALARRYRPDLAAGLLGETPAAAPPPEEGGEAEPVELGGELPRPDLDAAGRAARAPLV